MTSLTRQVHVGNVAIGGGAPISVQSMTTTDTADAESTLAQIEELASLGCEIIRVAIPTSAKLDGFAKICRRSPLPVVADIHFDHKLAIEATRRGAAALRINPGNIGSWEKVDAVIDAASAAQIPIRIGVNAGSLALEFDEQQDLSLPEKMLASCKLFVEHFEDRGFSDIVLSAKAHDVPTTLESYRMLSRELSSYPLHVGITEAGTLRQGSVKNAAGVGILLHEGIGDTIRLSLTADPKEEVLLAWDLLAALDIRRNKPELVSCPTCGRCEVDLIALASEVEERLAKLSYPISVAVMGCAVNGPGEAKSADIGVACGKKQGLIFAHGERLKMVSEDTIVDELMNEIHARFDESLKD